MPLGVDNSWSEEAFDAGFSISVAEPAPSLVNDLEFDVKGIDPAIANALRRILISEVPTVAIEHVFFVDNTSVIAVRWGVLRGVRARARKVPHSCRACGCGRMRC